MAHPDADWVGLGAKPCFRFEGRASKRNALAAEFQGVGNDRVQQAVVDWRARAVSQGKPKPVGRWRSW